MQTSRAVLIEARRRGSLVVSEPVYAETAAYVADKQAFDAFLERLGVRLEPSSAAALIAAGNAWRDYTRRRRGSLVCPECGNAQDVRCANCGRELRPRQHLVADLMIGAHALYHADRLLTRDRGFYASYFPDLKLM
jgi:predicted nucleic acid-binding protein